MRINFITFNNIRYRKPNNRLKQNFKGFDCDESSFEIKRTYNLPCPVCGVTMVQKNQIDNFVSKAKELKGEELVSLLTRHDKYFQELPKKVAEILKIEALRHPEHDILQLAHDYISKNARTLKYQQLEEIEKIRKNIGPLSKDSFFDAILNKYKDLINKGCFSKQEFIREIKTIIPSSVMNDKKLEKYLNKIPENETPEYKFMVKYSSDTPARFASSLIEPSLATCEHIVPKSLGGKNNTANYLAECNNDNSNKGDTPFSTWIIKKTGFKENLKRYLDTISEKIQNGEIPIDYVDYPLDIAKTISRETSGNISIEVAEITPSANQENDIQPVPNQNQANIQYKNKIKKLEELTALQNRLMNDGEYWTILEYIKLTQENERYTTLKKQLLDEISALQRISEKYYKSIIECDEIKETLTQPNLSKTETKSLKNKLDKLEKFIESKSIEDIEEELKSKIKELQDNIPVADSIIQRLNFIRSKITFPAEIESEIAKLKAELFRSTQISNQISKIRKDIKERVRLQSQVNQMESAVEGLARENKMLNISSVPQDEVERYKNINYILERSDTLQEACKKALGDKFLQFDSMIFDFSKENAEKELEIMYKNNDYARYQRNLNKIENLTKEIRSLQGKIAAYLSEESKLGELNNELNSMRFQGDIIQELEDLNVRLADLKEKFENINIDAKIAQCKKELEELKTKIRQDEQTDTNQE